MKIACAFGWTFFIFNVAVNEPNKFDKKVDFIIHFGSSAVALTIITLVAKFKRAIVDYTLVLLLTVRCISAFFLLRQLQDGNPNFEQIDLKEQTNAIPSLAVPAFILACCNFKFDVLFTFPMTILCIFLVDRQAMTPENDNLSCYVDPATLATKTSSIWFSYLAY